MSTDNTAKRVRALVASLREVGDSRTADLVESAIQPSASSSEVDPRKVWDHHQAINNQAKKGS